MWCERRWGGGGARGQGSLLPASWCARLSLPGLGDSLAHCPCLQSILRPCPLATGHVPPPHPTARRGHPLPHQNGCAKRRRSWRWPPPHVPPPPCASPLQRRPRSQWAPASRPARSCARRWAGAGWRCFLRAAVGSARHAGRGRWGCLQAARRSAPPSTVHPQSPPLEPHGQPLGRRPTLDLAGLAPPRRRVCQQVAQLLVVHLNEGCVQLVLPPLLPQLGHRLQNLEGAE